MQRLRQRVENEGDFQAVRFEVKPGKPRFKMELASGVISVHEKLGFDEEFCLEAKAAE